MRLRLEFLVGLAALAFLASAIDVGKLKASPLAACASQFVEGDAANAPQASPSASANIRHVCYRDDTVSFFATAFDLQATGPVWSAYRLDPANYGPDGCKTFTRGKANCYMAAETWPDYLACDRADDPFHSDRVLGAHSLAPNAFRNTGHDRGHIAPRQAFSWHVCGTYQTFTMANMSPQRGYLNQDTWQALEQQVLTWAVDEGPLHVVSGAVYDRFPHERFRVYQNGVFDPDWVYKPGRPFERIVEQHAANWNRYPRGDRLRPKRGARPDGMQAGARALPVPTGYYKVVYRPARGDDPARAIGFLIPHTFENVNDVPGLPGGKGFWAFVARIDLIEEVAGFRFPGIDTATKVRWGDRFFLARASSRNIRSSACGVGTPRGLAEGTTRAERLDRCVDKLR
jgi:DNA/RNA endonuclease G (NUC1)